MPTSDTVDNHGESQHALSCPIDSLSPSQSVMSVSEDLLCSFELLKPLDSAQLKKEMARGKRRASAAAAEAAAMQAAAASAATNGTNGASAAAP
jgi:hypothetical protein